MRHFITRQITAPAALLLLLLLFVKARSAVTEEKENNYTVRIVTISAPELGSSRIAMMTAPEDEAALFAHMTELVASGSAEVAGDTIMRGGPGKWSASANDEIPYPTEFDIDQKWRQVIPNSFTFRNTGLSVDAAIEDGADDHPGRLNFSWQRTRSTEGRIFPVITAKTFTQVEQPGFLTDKITGSITVAGGHWRLAGMTRPVEPEADAAKPARTLLTFVKVWHGSPSQTALPVSTETRLHFFVFRVPMEEGMGMATRRAGSDETLLEKLLDRAESGEIQLASHAACRLSPGTEARAEEAVESPADPFTVAGGPGASTAEGIYEYAYVTEYDPDPLSFSFQPLGHSFTVVPGPDYGVGAPGMSVKWELMDDSVKQLPLTPQPEGVTMTVPEFSTGGLKCSVVTSPGSVRMVGALQPDDAGPRMMHVLFLKNAGPAPTATQPPADHTEIHAAVISLPPKEGALLSAPGSERKWDSLEPLLKYGSARILAWQAVTGKPGTTASVKQFTETPVATKAAMHPAAGGLVYGKAYAFHTLGDSMELKLPGTPGTPFRGEISVNLEKPVPPAVSVLLSAAKAGTNLPGFEAAKTVFPAPGDQWPALTPGRPQIVRLAPCTAREGHAEHGRWHAVVLIVRER